MNKKISKSSYKPQDMREAMERDPSPDDLDLPEDSEAFEEQEFLEKEPNEILEDESLEQKKYNKAA